MRTLLLLVLIFIVTYLSVKIDAFLLASSKFSNVKTILSDAGVGDIIKDYKTKLISACAACDRGFGASKNDRKMIENYLYSLIAETRTGEIMSNPTLNLYPNNTTDSKAVIDGIWRMIYTDAYDVLSLAASPLTLLQSIYQVIDSNGNSCNIIDITARAVSLLPSTLAMNLESILRLKVYTSARARTEKRVGLKFMKVQAVPLSLFGQRNLPFLPPLSISLPQTAIYPIIDAFSGEGKNGESNDNTPGFFDILYLDEDILVIQQNQPGGIFISTRCAPEDVDYFETMSPEI